MLRIAKMALAALTIGAGLTIGGCAASKPSPDAMVGSPSTQGIACDKCKVTWVKMPVSGDKGHIVGYTDRKQMVCPECRDAVSNLFATGKYEHTCTACGGNMSGCAVH